MPGKSGLKFTHTEEDLLRRKGYELQKKIGQGGYAKVYYGKFQRLDGKQTELACKIIDTSKAPKKFLVKFLPRELKILSKLNHPHIIEIHSIILRKGRYYMFMRVAEKGDLLNYIVKNGAIKENRARSWTRQLGLAIQYLHTMSIAHRDIKCENILITAHNNVKLSDFGFARFILSSTESLPLLSDTFCGSLSYAAPEILKGEPYIPTKADIWSLGVVIYTMLNKSNPFSGRTAKVLYKNQISRNWKFRSKYSSSLSKEIKELMGKILEPDADKRLTIDDILKSSWIAMDPKLTRLNIHEHNALVAAGEEAKAMKAKAKERKFGGTYEIKGLASDIRNSVFYLKEYDEAGFDLQLIRSNVLEERLSS